MGISLAATALVTDRIINGGRGFGAKQIDIGSYNTTVPSDATNVFSHSLETRIANQNGIIIETYGENDHGPPHAHVKGEGAEVKIGANGKPLEKQPKLTAKQKKVIEGNLKEIRKQVNQEAKEHKKRKNEDKQKDEKNNQ